MDKYSDLELDILSCLIQRPELMLNLKLEDKHFAKFKRLWLFMKSFYKRFGDFDLVLMVSSSQDRYRMGNYIEMLVDREPAPSNFEKYQNRLLELYAEKKKDLFFKERTYKLATDLYLGNINKQEFKEKLKNAEFTADKLYGNSEI